MALGLGRFALKTPHGFVSVNPDNGEISLKKGRRPAVPKLFDG
jgi:hypothetical protein